VLAFIVGGWVFWRRRKRAKPTAVEIGGEEMSKREGDKMVVDGDAAPTSGAY
jgi:hypothetical protein